MLAVLFCIIVGLYIVVVLSAVHDVVNAILIEIEKHS